MLLFHNAGQRIQYLMQWLTTVHHAEDEIVVLHALHLQRQRAFGFFTLGDIQARDGNEATITNYHWNCHGFHVHRRAICIHMHGFEAVDMPSLRMCQRFNQTGFLILQPPGGIWKILPEHCAGWLADDSQGRLVDFNQAIFVIQDTCEESGLLKQGGKECFAVCQGLFRRLAFGDVPDIAVPDGAAVVLLLGRCFSFNPQHAAIG